MHRFLRSWTLCVTVLAASAFGVFVLPFLVPPAAFPMVSAANVAGFNNKVAALAAASVACLALLARLRWPALDPPALRPVVDRPLPRLVVGMTVLVYVGSLALLARYFAGVPVREILDAGYFLHQLADHAVYGRRLYTEIEFPYGPILFYGPLAMRALLSPLHVSLTGAYYVTLLLEHLLGLVFLAYLLNSLPLSVRWKTLLFLFIAVSSLNFDFGLNYTLFRFTLAPACLVLTSRMRSFGAGLFCLFFGEVLAIALSPEMGFAFAAGAAAYAAYRAWSDRRLAWLAGVVAPGAAAALFLWLNSDGYLLMLGMFAKGVFNLIVEPQPNVLVFLAALVWFTPLALVPAVRSRAASGALPVALFLYTLALLPVAFGRADGGHVLLNCYPAFLLAGVALSRSARAVQAGAALALVCSLLFTLPIGAHFYKDRLKEHLHASIYFHPDWAISRATLALLRPHHAALAAHLAEPPKLAAFSLEQLTRITGGEPVITPQYVPIGIEQDLQRSHQYVPTFYYFGPVLDLASEDRQLSRMHQVDWALIPDDTVWTYSEDPTSTVKLLGADFHYRSRRPVWIAGELLKQDLDRNWTVAAHIGGYVLYHRTTTARSSASMHGTSLVPSG